MQIGIRSRRRHASGVCARHGGGRKVKQSADPTVARSWPTSRSVPASSTQTNACTLTQCSLCKRQGQRAVRASAASDSQAQGGNTSSNALWIAIAYVATLAINYGSNVGIFFGNTNADVRCCCHFVATDLVTDLRAGEPPALLA